jgi:hypothetical protein
MKPNNLSKPKTRKKTGRKILKWLLAIVAALIVLVFLLTPAFISSEKCRRIILTKINKSIEGRTDFADLSMGWRKGIKVADLSFDDNKGQISVRVKQIATKPHYASILTGNLSFGQTLIDQPKVQINLKDQKLTHAPQQKPPASKPQPYAMPIKNIDLIVKDGDFKVTDSKSQTIQLSQINSTVNLRPPGRPTSFNINTTVVDKTEKSKINAAGSITPHATKTGWSLKETTGNLTVEITDLNLQSLAPLFALAKLEASAKGTISASLKSDIKDGQLENLNGIVNAKNLDITTPQLKGDRFQTNTLNAAVSLTHTKETVNIEKLQLKTDWANLSAAGTVPTTLKSLTDFLQPDSNYALKGAFDCNLPAILSQMPKTLGLKEGTKISSGKLSGTIETLSQAGKKHIQADATLTGLQGQLEGKKIALSQPLTAQAIVSSDKAGITFDKLDILSSFAKVTCTGSTSGEQSQIRTQLLEFDADVDLAKFQSEFGQFANLGPYQMAGQLLTAGQLSIKENIIAAVGSSTIKNLHLSTKDAAVSEPLANISFSFDIDRQNNFAAIESLKTDASLGQLNIKDAVLPLNEKTAKPLRLIVNATNLDLQKLQPFAVLFASFPREIQLSGLADSSVSVTSQNDIYTVATDSTKIRNLKLTSQNGPLFEQSEVSLALDARLNPEQKTINIKKIQWISPQLKINKVEVSEVAKAGKTLLQGKLDCEFDWAVVNPFLLSTGLIVKGTNKLPIEFSSEYPIGQRQKLPDNLSTKGTLGFTQAEYRGLVFDRTEAQIQIQKGFFTILPFSTKVNNGDFYFAGQGDFKQKPTFLQTPKPMQMMTDIQINDQVAAGLLRYVNPIFANALNVSGIANLACERLAIPLFGKPPGELEIIGTISVNKLHLQVDDWFNQILSLIGLRISGVDITVHPTKFVLQKRILSYDNMQIDFGDNPFIFKGAIGLDKSLNMTVLLPYTTEGRTARIGRETPGQRISVPLKGTIDKPNLDMGKLFEEQLKQKLLEGLDKLLK